MAARMATSPIRVLQETRDALEVARRQLQVDVDRNLTQGETFASAVRIAALHYDEWVALLKEGKS
jgi:hypothetical protein